MTNYRLKTGKAAKKATETYQKIENTFVDGYQKIENAFVGGYQKIEDAFVDRFMEEVPEDKTKMEE